MDRKYADAMHHFMFADSSISPIVNEPGLGDDSDFGYCQWTELLNTPSKNKPMIVFQLQNQIMIPILLAS